MGNVYYRNNKGRPDRPMLPINRRSDNFGRCSDGRMDRLILYTLRRTDVQSYFADAVTEGRTAGRGIVFFA